jgi:hypothetical protein
VAEAEAVAEGVGEDDVVVGALGAAWDGVVLVPDVGLIATSEPGQNRSAATTPPASSATTISAISARDRRGFARRARAMITTPELVRTGANGT